MTSRIGYALRRMPTTIDPVPGAAPWWVATDSRSTATAWLTIAGRDAEQLARDRSTPLLVYDRVQFVENARRLLDAPIGRAFAIGSGLR